MVTLWGRRWSRAELSARVGRLEQVAGIRLVEGGDRAERGVRVVVNRAIGLGVFQRYPRAAPGESRRYSLSRSKSVV